MVVVVVIGLLAAIAIPAFKRVQQRATASRYINDFRQFDSAFQRYAQETGQWPPSAGLRVMPAGMQGYLPAAFTSTAPMGGSFHWSGPSAVILLTSSGETDAIMQQVDAALDDGNLATGSFMKIIGLGYGYQLK